MRDTARYVLLASAMVLTACGEVRPQIAAADVERVLGALSHDSMMGRAAFTPDADRAARFIAAEFAALGLESPGNVIDHLQAFTVYSITPGRARVILNGRAVPSGLVATSLSTEELQWSTSNAIPVTVLGRDAPMPQSLGDVRRAGGDQIVLLHPAHRQWFTRVRGQPRRTLSLGEGPNTVYILSDTDSVRSYAVTASATATAQRLANVVGRIPGARPDEIVLFSAHYDHIGVRTPVQGDSIANGANDDASGVTAVIELARYFTGRGAQPTRTLVFAAFTAEEAGGFGSRYFSQQLDPDEIVAMFNIEMIGKVATEGPNSAWITGFDRSTFGEILQRAVAGTDYRFSADPYPEQNLFYRSDNATLARLGVPAHSISTTPIDVDEDYHQVTDHIETLDLAHVANTIVAIALGARSIVSGEETPTRVDPEAVRQ